ncbi:unnamed protein product [Lampetra fluviatilis]
MRWCVNGTLESTPTPWLSVSSYRWLPVSSDIVLPLDNHRTATAIREVQRIVGNSGPVRAPTSAARSGRHSHVALWHRPPAGVTWPALPACLSARGPHGRRLRVSRSKATHEAAESSQLFRR